MSRLFFTRFGNNDDLQSDTLVRGGGGAGEAEEEALVSNESFSQLCGQWCRSKMTSWKLHAALP